MAKKPEHLQTFPSYPVRDIAQTDYVSEMCQLGKELSVNVSGHQSHLMLLLEALEQSQYEVFRAPFGRKEIMQDQDFHVD